MFWGNKIGLSRGGGGGGGRGGGRGAGGGRGGGGRGGRGGPLAVGPGGNCLCPKCGYKEQHTVGQPCYEKVCPKCGTRMTRE